MALLKFLRGSQANLASQSIVDGALYFTTDSHKIYMGTANGLQEYSAIEVASSISALPAVADAIQGKFYYAEAENVFCFAHNGVWQQVNPDTGATSIEVTGSGNAVTAASYDAATRKITLTKGATYMNAADVDGKIATAVGELGNDEEGNAYANVKAYVDAKTEGIATDAALSELQGKVTTAEGEIDALQAAIAEGGSVANAIAAAKKAGDDAQAAADQAQGEIDALELKVGEVAEGKTVVGLIDDAQKQADKGVADAATAKGVADEALELAGTKATMDEVNAAIAGAGHAVKSDVDKAIADMDAAYKKADSDLEAALQANIDKKVDKSAYDTKMAELEGADTTLQGNIDKEAEARAAADDAQVKRIAALEGQITGLSGAMHFKGVEDEIPADVEGYVDGDVIIVGNKEYVFNGGAFVEFGDVSAEGDRITELERLVGKEAEGENAATGLHEDVAKNAAAIAQEVQDRKDADKALSDRIDEIHGHENLTVLDGITAEKVAAWDAAQANVIETVMVNGEALEVTDKAVDIAIPTGALASKDAVAKTDLAKALADEIDAKAVAADVETELGKKVDKVEGKSLVADAEITKLAGVSEGANKVEASDANGKIKIDGVETVVYTHPATHAISEVAGLQDVLDTKLEAADIANKADKATTLAGYGIADAYTKAEIEALLQWGEF